MREESGLTFIKVPIMENIGGEMMEGSTFYFVAWIGWIVVTFYEKGLYSVEDKRLYIDFIICSPLHVTIASFTVSVNALLLSGIAFIGLTLYSIWKNYIAYFRHLLLQCYIQVFIC